MLRRQRPDQDPALEAFARLNDGCCHLSTHPKKKQQHQDMTELLFGCELFTRFSLSFGYYIPICTLQVIALDVSVEFHCLLVEHIKPVEAWDSPSAETPSGSPILSHHSSPRAGQSNVAKSWVVIQKTRRYGKPRCCGMLCVLQCIGHGFCMLWVLGLLGPLLGE